MIDETLLRRITVNPEIFGGKPIIRGMRISVELILSLLAQGETPETILTDYPDLEPDDLRACLAYAHAAIAHDPPLSESDEVLVESRLAAHRSNPTSSVPLETLKERLRSRRNR